MSKLKWVPIFGNSAMLFKKAAGDGVMEGRVSYDLEYNRFFFHPSQEFGLTLEDMEWIISEINKEKANAS